MANDAELKEVLKAIADTELLISQVVSSGFTFSEIGQLITVAQDFPPVIRDGSVMLPEWISLDDDARTDLMNFIGQNEKFPANVTIEQYTQKLLTAAILLSKIVALFLV